jgi:DNA-binding NarL/FixJ family response regulator
MFSECSVDVASRRSNRTKGLCSRALEGRVKVLIVEDHPVMLQGLSQLVQQSQSGALVEHATQVDEARRHAQAGLAPELVLLDPGLPDLQGRTAIRALTQLFPDAILAVISANDLPQDVEAAFDAGAHGFLSKAAQPAELVRALQDVARGQRVLLTRQGKSPAPPSVGADGGLSERQLEVLRAICEGQSNKQVASALQIAEKTVKVHVSAIFEKLGVANRTQAMLVAQRLGLVMAQRDAARAERQDPASSR